MAHGTQSSPRHVAASPGKPVAGGKNRHPIAANVGTRLHLEPQLLSRSVAHCGRVEADIADPG